MRVAVLGVLFVLASTPLGACCDLTVMYGPWYFQGSTAAFLGRWDGAGAFRVEKVFHGDLAAGGSFPAAPDHCQPLAKRARYLVTRNCNTGHCYVHWIEEADAKPLLAYLKTAHGETLQSVSAQHVRWQDGALSHAAFREWLLGALIRSETPERDALLEALISQLEGVTHELGTIESCDRARAQLLFRQHFQPLRDLGAEDVLKGLKRGTLAMNDEVCLESLRG
ncbi:MAG TPA: hypothetical protein VFP80_10880 [Thermoanaerobaculia bacterium]|nr:hypothetical protein [Thermoanaerobaculia bacterium]